jgi:death-on-curing protein
MRGLIEIHKQLLARYGGHSREVDMPKLELALTRTLSFADDGMKYKYARIAAGYAWALLFNRPFVEGNERVALAALVTFLEMYELQWKCGEVEETAMVLELAAGTIKEEDWTGWVMQKVGNRKRPGASS